MTRFSITNFYLTGSNPPRRRGWHRSRRPTDRRPPRIKPYSSIASAAYSEHVGVNRHAAGSQGEMIALYTRTIFTPRFCGLTGFISLLQEEPSVQIAAHQSSGQGRTFSD